MESLDPEIVYYKLLFNTEDAKQVGQLIFSHNFGKYYTMQKSFYSEHVSDQRAAFLASIADVVSRNTVKEVLLQEESDEQHWILKLQHLVKPVIWYPSFTLIYW